MLRFAAICPVVLALTVPSGAYAADRRPLSIELRTGAAYERNVSVEQADVVARRGDSAHTLGASIKYRLADFGKTTLTTGYDFDQTTYSDLSNYNLQIHGFYAGSATRIGKSDLGADYRFYHIKQGGAPFLDMQMVSPSFGGFVSKRVYLRASYTYFNKAFATSNKLDANTHDLDGNAYYFFPKKRGFVSMAVRYEYEDTVDPTRDYDALQVTGNLQLPIEFVAAGSKIRLGLAYRYRDYRHITPSIGVPRYEERYSINASADIPVGHGFSIKPELKMADRNSNDPYFNYADNKSAISLIYRY